MPYMARIWPACVGVNPRSWVRNRIRKGRTIVPLRLTSAAGGGRQTGRGRPAGAGGGGQHRALVGQEQDQEGKNHRAAAVDQRGRGDQPDRPRQAGEGFAVGGGDGAEHDGVLYTERQPPPSPHVKAKIEIMASSSSRLFRPFGLPPPPSPPLPVALARARR